MAINTADVLRITHPVARIRYEAAKRIADAIGAGGGSGGSTWDYYVTNWSTPPTQIASITGGVVLSYTLDGITRYRFVPSPYDPTDDAFYTTFTNPTLSGLIVARG